MSMARKLVKTADSPSLWNYSLSPGWTQETSEILRLAIIKFGCGNWKAIIESKCLPGKTRSQLNLQTQRMVGQQSIAQFKGIHLDTRVVWKDIQEKHRNNPNTFVKNGLIINTGNNQTKEEKDKLRRANTKKYSLPRSDIEAVELQVVDIEDIVAEGKGKRRRLKERKVLAPGEGEKLKARLQVLRDRLATLEKELKDRGVPLTEPKRPRLGAVSSRATAATKRKRAMADDEEEEEEEAAFEINDECFEAYDEDDDEEDELEEEEDEEVEILEEEVDDDEEVDVEGEEESGFSGEEPPSSTNAGKAKEEAADISDGGIDDASLGFYFGSQLQQPAAVHNNQLMADSDADAFAAAVLGGAEEDDDVDSDFEEEPSRKKRRIAPSSANGRVPPKRGGAALLPKSMRPVVN